MALPGDLVRGRFCPKCGRESIVYNGNYFCSNEGSDGCDWAMSDWSDRRGPAVEVEIVKAYLLQRYNEHMAEGDEEQAQYMTRLLVDGGFVPRS